MAQQENGRVQRLVRDKGFGFIKAEDGRELFFHRSGVDGGDFDALNEGHKVTFVEEPSAKGPRAGSVRLQG